MKSEVRQQRAPALRATHRRRWARRFWTVMILVSVGFAHTAPAEEISLRYGQAFSANESVYSLPILVADREGFSRASG